MSSGALEWGFSQVFGERTPGDEVHNIDIISAIEFDRRGEYIATGDRGGRVVIFEKMDGQEPRSWRELEQSDYRGATIPRYAYKMEFQSHEPEFDYLKSLEIEEKINKVRWCVAPNDSLFILSTNSRTIKLWKIVEQKAKMVKEMELNPYVCSENALLAEKSFTTEENGSTVPNGYRLEWTNGKPNNKSPGSQGASLLMPNIGVAVSSRCRRVYAHGHEYNINSISNNSDGETYISADDLRINLWNLEVSDQCFNIIDMKPSNMEDLIEVITSAEFHPNFCNILAYSSSRGFIRLVDMRRSAICDKNARILQDRDSHGSRSFFTEIIAAISDIKFTNEGRHILSRDYMNLKLWDLRMETSPITTFKIHEYLRPKICDLYNNDSIFDKFECCMSRDGHYFASGSYSNLFRVFTSEARNEDGITLEASKNPYRTHFPSATKRGRLSNFTRGHLQKGHDHSSLNGNGTLPLDLTSKVVHMAWHPQKNLIACAAVNSLYMYYLSEARHVGYQNH